MMQAPVIHAVKYDGTLVISTGKSRKETHWKTRDLSWSELLAKLSQTTRTRETVAEYKAMRKAEQDEIKDVGGFVGGSLKGGRRKAENVVWRQLLVLDADYASKDFWADVVMVSDYACCIYSTHKHTQDKPRLRWVIPLSRPVTPDEYPAIGRRVAADHGIDQFDDSTYETARLMYWPSTSSDGEYVFEYQDGPWLDPDTVLARYPDWKDPSYWPDSSRVKAQRKKLADKQGDPTLKPGMVGAFCRTYSVEEAIEAFLPDVYEPAGDGRYSYIPGSTAGGLVVYDGGYFVYSHHGTDPVGGLLVNAFDLVRIHRFGVQDEDVEPGKPVNQLPSYKAMVEMAQQDERVKRQLGQERMAEAGNDFTGEDMDWTAGLAISKKGEVEPSLSNLVLIIRNDPNLKNIAFDQHRDAVVLTGPVPWRTPEGAQGPDWGDKDDSNLYVYLERTYKSLSRVNTDDALVTVSMERSFHPVKDWLESLDEWDGLPRVEYLLSDYLGAEDSEYVREVTKKTLVAAVARIYKPGVKFDSMLVLVGPQGIGKSSLFRRMAGRWFNDSLRMTDTKDKTAAEKLQGYWILEIGEMSGIRHAEVEAVKSFVSRQEDIYRPSFGKRTVKHPRQNILVGSTNNDTGFLQDTTGNRRFWPVKVAGGARRKPWDIDDYTLGQLWAEALELYKDGEDLYLKGSAADEAIRQQAEMMENDERLGMIRRYLEILLPEDWEERGLAARRSFLRGDSDEVGTVQRDRVCASDILYELFEIDKKDMNKYKALEILGLLSQIDGWKKYEGKLRSKSYGMQRHFVREWKQMPKDADDAGGRHQD